MAVRLEKKLRDLLREVEVTLAKLSAAATGLSGAVRKRLHDAVVRSATELAQFGRAIDPVSHPVHTFDPTNPHDAGVLIGNRLEEVPRYALREFDRFWGSGVYALYYRGSHPAYRPISGTDIPIYVGKAEPTDEKATSPKDQGQALYKRLSEHRKSLSRAEAHSTNAKKHRIRLAEFEFRYLVVASTYAGAAELNLQNRYRPAWNTVLPGFGKHGDSPTTRSNTRSEWDTLHPGRDWATRAGNKPNPKTREELQAELVKHLDKVKRELGQ